MHPSINPRLLAASCVALIGVGAVVWSGVRLFGGPAPASSALPQLAPEDVDGPRLIDGDPSGDTVSIDTLQRSLRDSVAKSDVLSGFALDAKQEFATAAWTAIMPFLSGTFEDYVKSTQILGDPVDVSADIEQSWRAFADHNPIDSIASEEVVIERFAGAGRKRSMYEDGKRMIRTGFSGMATSSNETRYPDAAAFLSRSLDVVEVRTLVKMKNDGKLFDVVLGVAMAWDPVQRRWQPVEHRVYHKKDAPVIVMPPM